MKYKKYRLFLIILALFIFSGAKNVQASEILSSQQLEIMSQEIGLLKLLVSSSGSCKNINAASYIAVDLSDNSVVMEKNSSKVYSIASVTKLMNAVVALENIKMDQTIVLTDEMLKPLGQTPCLYAGLEISASDLLKAMLIQSTNDAAQALSYFLGNEKYIALMNQKAKELGMNDTVYCDVHGLNSANRSTATDLTKLVAYIYKQHPDILNITKNNDFWLPDSKGLALKFRNVNNFYPLSNFVGGKTGYLVEAKQTFASIFKVNQKPIAIIVLYSNNRMADTFDIINQIKNKI